MNSNFKRILVFRIGHLGDTIVSLPALWSIRESFPDARLTLMSNSDPQNPEYVLARSVLPESGLFDDWIVYPHTPKPIVKLKSYAGLFRKLRSGHFDAAFYLMPRIRSSKSIKRDVLFLKSAGVKNVLGSDFLSRNLVDPAMAAPLPLLEREADFLVELVKDSGMTPSAKGCDMLLTEAEIGNADRWLLENCGESFGSTRLIALAPGSKWDSKKWSESRYVSVVKRLVESRGAFPVVFGGPEDKAKGDRVLEAIGAGVNAAGELGVREGTAAMRNFDLYLGNDTGTMHMAAAAGIRCVAIFAAIDFPGRWYPYGEGHRVFRVPVECEGCHTPDCFNKHLCLESVPTDDVYEACEKALDSVEAS